MSDDDPPPAGQRVSPKDFAPFALAALIGLASIALPGPGLDWTLFAVATGLTVLIAIAGFAAAVTGRAPIMMLLGPLAYLCVVALLRHASPTGGGGFVPLIILPVVFLALFGTRRQLLIGLVAMAAVLLVPALVYGEPRYAASAWRSTVLWLTVAALTGLSIQTLVARVREGLAFSNAVVDTAGSLVMVLDPQGRIERFNQACERLTGRTEAEMRGHLPDKVVAEGHLERVVAMFQNARVDDYPITFEIEWIAADGSRRLIAWTNSILLDADGEIAHVVAAGSDITSYPAPPRIASITCESWGRRRARGAARRAAAGSR